MPSPMSARLKSMTEGEEEEEGGEEARRGREEVWKEDEAGK